MLEHSLTGSAILFYYVVMSTPEEQIFERLHAPYAEYVIEERDRLAMDALIAQATVQSEVQEASQALAGKRVAVRELDRDSEGIRPITRYGMYNSLNVVDSGPGSRSRLDPSTGQIFIPGDMWVHRKKIQGKVVGLDIESKSLVVRPRFGYFTRYWVKVADSDGRLLVELDFKDQNG